MDKPKVKKIIVIDENGKVEYDGDVDVFAAVWWKAERDDEHTTKSSGYKRFSVYDNASGDELAQLANFLNKLCKVAIAKGLLHVIDDK